MNGDKCQAVTKPGPPSSLTLSAFIPNSDKPLLTVAASSNRSYSIGHSNVRHWFCTTPSLQAEVQIHRDGWYLFSPLSKKYKSSGPGEWMVVLTWIISNDILHILKIVKTPPSRYSTHSIPEYCATSIWDLGTLQSMGLLKFAYHPAPADPYRNYGAYLLTLHRMPIRSSRSLMLCTNIDEKPFHEF